MKKLGLALAVVLAFTGGALAGDCGDCPNRCPIEVVGERRSTGAEAVAVSKVVQKDAIRLVLKNAASI